MTRAISKLAAIALGLSVGVAGVAMAARAAEAPPDWQVFRSESGRFEVVFPGIPQLRETSHRTWVGRVASAEYVLYRDGVELRVEHHDLPAVARFVLGEEALLRRAADDFLADNDARERSFREIRHGGNRARELTFESADGDAASGHAILVLLRGRLYLAAVFLPPGSAFATEGFLPSFAVWD